MLAMTGAASAGGWPAGLFDHHKFDGNLDRTGPYISVTGVQEWQWPSWLVLAPSSGATYVTGKWGQALQHYNCGYVLYWIPEFPASVWRTQDWTWSFWVRPDVQPALQFEITSEVMMRYYMGGTTYRPAIYNSFYDCPDGDHDSRWVYANSGPVTSAPPVGQWRFVKVVKQGTIMHLFVDGTQWTWGADATACLWTGYPCSPGSNHWDGSAMLRIRSQDGYVFSTEDMMLQLGVADLSTNVPVGPRL